MSCQHDITEGVRGFAQSLTFRRSSSTSSWIGVNGPMVVVVGVVVVFLQDFSAISTEIRLGPSFTCQLPTRRQTIIYYVERGGRRQKHRGYEFAKTEQVDVNGFPLEVKEYMHGAWIQRGSGLAICRRITRKCSPILKHCSSV